MELSPPDTGAMNDEWAAWRDVCTELKALGVDLNDHDRLTHAMRLWGERLVALRLPQDDDTLYQARVDAENGYTPSQAVIDAR